MPAPTNIALFGFMATGKSTVGRLVAARLDWQFADVDTLIEQDAGMPITEIFAAEAETGFRQRERHAVEVAAAMQHTVIATGGGVVLDTRNMEAFATSSLMICLRLSAEETFARIRHDTTRPLLQHADPLQRIREMQTERAPYYDAIPHQIDRDTLSPEQTADRIVQLYETLAKL